MRNTRQMTDPLLRFADMKFLYERVVPPKPGDSESAEKYPACMSSLKMLDGPLAWTQTAFFAVSSLLDAEGGVSWQSVKPF